MRSDATAARGTASAIPSPTGSPTPERAHDLSFGPAEERIKGDWIVGWTNPFKDNDRFTPVDPGEWVTSLGYRYEDAENGCRIDVGGERAVRWPTGVDDRSLSDRKLAEYVAAVNKKRPTPGDIESMGIHAVDDAIPQVRDGATVDFRVWQTSQKNKSLLFAARVFGEQGGTLIITVICSKSTAASDEYKRVVRKDVHVDARATKK